MNGREHLRIGEVAARTELSFKTIRHYDEIGVVVPSARSAGGFRLYTLDDVDRLLTIRRMKPLGFTLDEMRRLLAALDTLNAESATEHDRAQALSAVDELHSRAQTACIELTRQLAYAHELTGQLAGYRT